MILPNGYNYNLVEIIEDSSLDKARATFVQMEILEWTSSRKYNLMIEGHRYYSNDNDINDRERTILGEKTDKLSNNRIAHPFVHKLTEQKVSYLLSEKPSIKVVGEESETKQFQEILETFFNEGYCKRLQNTGRKAVLSGIGWQQVFYDENGQFQTALVPSEQIIPYWKDTEHNDLDAIIRFYEIKNVTTKEISLKAEFWLTPGENEPGGVYYYEIINGTCKPDTSMGNGGYMTHFTIDGVGYNWDKIPFIPFKYNDFELPLLKLIKSMNDAYDASTSDMANDIEDVPNRLLKLVNYPGTDLKELREFIKESFAINVGENGNIDTIDMSINGDIVENLLNRLKEDIYDFGSGVDQTKASTRVNQSGVALKFLYAGLDLDCKNMGQNFRAGLERLYWFYSNHLFNIGQGDFTQLPVKTTFNTNMIINQSELITDIQHSEGLVSERTLLENHPFVTDVQAELDELEKAKPKAPDTTTTDNLNL